MKNEEEDDYFNMQDLSIEDLKKNLNETNKELLDSLKIRFTQNLLNSMIFFIFNQICETKQTKDRDVADVNEKSMSNIFFSHWFKSMEKQLKKEMLTLNGKLKNERLNYLNAISSFSLPSTEDYQLLYNKALTDTKKFFEDNTRI